MASTTTPDLLAEEARLGQQAFDRHVRPRLTSEDDGKFVAVDIDTGEYEIDADDYAASERLLVRRPDARGWLLRVGEATTYRLGRRAEVR